MLPRSPLATTDQLSNDAEHFVNALACDVVPKAVTIEGIQETSRKDDLLRQVREQIEIEKRLKEPGYKPCHVTRRELWISNDNILKGSTLVIPTSLREKILSTAHKHHLGIVKTKGLLKEKVWWPGIDKDVEQMMSCLPSDRIRDSSLRTT